MFGPGSSALLSLIVAVAENGVIGREGGLPWRMPSDLKTFRRLTMGKPIVMGRRTFQSIGRPLDGRTNIVVTRDPAFAADGVTVLDSIEAALILARGIARTGGSDEVMVIGGGDIFAATLPIADRIYWTSVKGAPEGDIQFPELDPSEWTEVSREAIPPSPRDEYPAELRVLERRSA
ncbi:MAG: dihydrofolate reductase [Hyphomicrobium sp.]|nr:dihydrofolate reductase [Hyphomicrobium sp.]